VGSDLKFEQILLDPVYSSKIQTEMKMLGDQIVQHMENNYHMKPIGTNSREDSSSQRLCI
jgi:hypothetical protein